MTVFLSLDCPRIFLLSSVVDWFIRAQLQQNTKRNMFNFRNRTLLYRAFPKLALEK